MSIVRKRKKTLFGRVVRKIESELTPRQDKHVSSDVPLDGSYRSGDEVEIIKSRRDELKSAGYDNSEKIEIVV
jgi:hypothetical protein